MAVWTAQRIPRGTVVALAHQGVFGAPASAAGALVRAHVISAQPLRGTRFYDPPGLTGSEFLRDYHAEGDVLPGFRIRLFAGARAFLAAVLEHALHGQPSATLAAGDVVETGDTANALSAWALTGIRPAFNTDAAFKLYVKLEDETPGAGQARVSLYSDGARTALVARGSAADGAIATLAEQNGSGLSGTVTLGTVAASNLTSCVLTIMRVRPARAAAIARYLTAWRDTGHELEALSDATVRRLRLMSEESGRLVVEADLVGAGYAIAASALAAGSAAPADQWFQHARASLTWNGVAQAAIRFEHGIDHDVVQHSAMAATPAIYKRGSRLTAIMTQRFANESRAMRDDGAAGTWRPLAADYAYGRKHLTVAYPRAKLVGFDLPASGADVEKHVLELEARDDGAEDPIAIALDL